MPFIVSEPDVNARPIKVGSMDAQTMTIEASNLVDKGAWVDDTTYDYTNLVSSATSENECNAIVDGADFTGTTGNVTDGHAFCASVAW